MLNLALLKVQNSPASGGLRQLNFRALRIDKHGDPKKDLFASQNLAAHAFPVVKIWKGN